MINLMKGHMKPVGVFVVDGADSMACSSLLKKKPLLRLFHILTFQDTSAFLLDPFGRPMSFNRAGVGDFFIGSLEDSIINGYRCSLSDDESRVRIEYRASLAMLCLCPWIYNNKTKCQLTTGDQYRIGREKTNSIVSYGMELIKLKAFKL